MNHRESIFRAAKDLFTSRGYSATSPREIIERAAAGKGSFYHHFPSKLQLAAEVFSVVSDEMIGVGREQLCESAPPKKRLEQYLLAERDALRGCRLGRLAYDDVALSEPELTRSSQSYFVEVEALLVEIFAERRGASGRSAEGARNMASVVLATIQGGYVLSRIHNDATYMDRAVRGLMSLLETSEPPVKINQSKPKRTTRRKRN